MPWACLSFLVLVACTYLLVTGSPWLEYRLVGAIDFPVGTLVAWLGLIALPSTIHLATATHQSASSTLDRFRSLLLKIDLVLAGSWGVMAYALAGNWAFSFSGWAPSFRGSDKASYLFWTYSIIIVLLALLVMALLIASKLLGARRPKKSA